MKTFAALSRSIALLAAVLICQPTQAAIVASGFFSGTLERFDPDTNAQTTFATIASPDDPFPQLSGVAYNPQTDRYAVSARASGRVYIVDGATGAVTGFRQLSGTALPASVVFGPNNSIYVADNGSNNILRLNSDNTITTFTLPEIPTGPTTTLGPNLPSGLAFDGNGDLIVSTFAGAGMFRLNPSTGVATPIGGSPLGNGQLAINDAGVIYAGGAAFSNDIASFDPTSGVVDPSFITIDGTLLPPPPFMPSSMFTSPSGIAIDADGTFLVAALGRTNPGENFDNGGLFRFAADGSFLEDLAVNSTPFSSVVVAVAIPEPSSMAALAVVCIVGAAVGRKRYIRRGKAGVIVG